MSNDGYTPGPRQAVADPPAGYVTDAECARRVKAEREACAQVADYYADADYSAMNYEECCGLTASRTADMVRAAIRARQEGEG